MKKEKDIVNIKGWVETARKDWKRMEGKFRGQYI